MSMVHDFSPSCLFTLGWVWVSLNICCHTYPSLLLGHGVKIRPLTENCWKLDGLGFQMCSQRCWLFYKNRGALKPCLFLSPHQKNDQFQRMLGSAGNSIRLAPVGLLPLVSACRSNTTGRKLEEHFQRLWQALQISYMMVRYRNI